MIAFNRILASVLVFASAAVVLATNTDNSTLLEHAPVVLTCGADTPPLANMSTPDGSQLLVNSATTMDFPTSIVVKVTWSVNLMNEFSCPYSRATPVRNVIYKDTCESNSYFALEYV